MADTVETKLSIERLSEQGQITIPAEYRRALALSGDALIILVQVGDALVMAPYDGALTPVTERLEAAMQNSDVEVDDLIEAANQARADIIRDEFGQESNQ